MNKNVYQKDRKGITDPIVRVPESSIKGVSIQPKKAYESSKGIVVVHRNTGWLIAGLFVSLIFGVGYLSTLFFKKEHTLSQLERHTQQLQESVELLEIHTQMLERRLVELETQIESLKEARR